MYLGILMFRHLNFGVVSLFFIVGRSARNSCLFTVHSGERLPAGDAVAISSEMTTGGNVRQLTRTFQSLCRTIWELELDP
jgi:hypothetical protein